MKLIYINIPGWEEQTKATLVVVSIPLPNWGLKMFEVSHSRPQRTLCLLILFFQVIKALQWRLTLHVQGMWTSRRPAAGFAGLYIHSQNVLVPASRGSCQNRAPLRPALR